MTAPLYVFHGATSRSKRGSLLTSRGKTHLLPQELAVSDVVFAPLLGYSSLQEGPLGDLARVRVLVASLWSVRLSFS